MGSGNTDQLAVQGPDARRSGTARLTGALDRYRTICIAPRSLLCRADASHHD